MPSKKQDEIAAVRRAEQKRGRKQPRLPEKAQQTRLEELIEKGTDEEFARALIERGWQRGSPEFDDALAAFRVAQQSRRSSA